MSGVVTDEEATMTNGGPIPEDAGGIKGRKQCENRGVIRELADLPDDAQVGIKQLAAWYGRTERSIINAVRRGELPPPVKMIGRYLWTVGSLRQGIRQLQAKATKDWQRQEDRRQERMAEVGMEG
jgi:hypothetical protein